MVKSYKTRKKGALHLPIYLERGFKNNQIEVLHKKRKPLIKRQQKQMRNI